jgi:acetyl esterase
VRRPGADAANSTPRASPIHRARDENDVLRDEGEAYAHKLMQAGVRVTAVRYLGAIHDFVMLNALAQSPEAEGAVAQASAALRIALAR